MSINIELTGNLIILKFVRDHLIVVWNACIAGTIKFGKSHVRLRRLLFFYSVPSDPPERGLYQHQVDVRREAAHM
jgi:hypothetical protein